MRRGPAPPEPAPRQVSASGHADPTRLSFRVGDHQVPGREDVGVSRGPYPSPACRVWWFREAARPRVGSGIGTAASSDRVYSWVGCSYNRSESAISTISPERITATR